MKYEIFYYAGHLCKNSPRQHLVLFTEFKITRQLSLIARAQELEPGSFLKITCFR